PARSLRPGQRIVEVGLIIGLVKLALFRGETIDLLADGRELDLLRLASCTLALADEIEGHFRPPTVAVAVAGRAIGQSGAVRSFIGDRLELGERLGLGIEAKRAVGRGRPYLALPVVIDRGGTAGRRHALRRHVDVNALGLGIEAAETAAAVIHIEPYDALLVARHAMRLGRETVERRHLEELHRSACRINLADSGAPVGDIAGEPELTVKVKPGVMHAPAGDEHRGGPQRPIAAVVLHEILGKPGIRIQWNVVFLEHDARRLPYWTRIQLEFHRTFTRAGRAGEIGGELLLVIIENPRRLALATHERAIDIGVLHELYDRVPAGLIELVLENVARGMTPGANRAHDAFHALIVVSILRERRKHDVARQLPYVVLQWLEHEGLFACCEQIELRLGRFEG